MEVNRISVVIVSFHRATELRASLTALRGSGLQVIVVDNGSRDGSPALAIEFSEVRFSRLPRNFGFTRALNIGIRAAEGEYVLLLHDDVRIEPAAVLALAGYLEAHPDVAAVCPHLDTPQIRRLPTPSDPDPGLAVAPAGADTTTECVSGAAMMVRSQFLRSMSQIDERYGNYGTDLEICAQIRTSGRKVVILGAVTADHGTKPSPMPPGYLQGDRITGTAAYLGKHHGFAAGLIYRLKSSLFALATLRFRLAVASRIDGGG